MQLTLRLAVVGILVATTHLLVLGIHHGMEPSPAELPTAISTSLPDSMGDFKGHDEPLDERLVAGSDADIMINRVYRNQLGDLVIANLGVWTRYEKTIPHSPEICYTMAGWEIASRKELTIPVAPGQDVGIKRYVFQRGTSRIAVAFWVHLDSATFAESEGVRHTRQRLRMSRRSLPPLVKVMLQTDARDVAQADFLLSRFAADVMPLTQTIR